MPVYFITWTTYGTWLHGDAKESVSHHSNDRAKPKLAPNPALEHANATRMRHPAFIMAIKHRRIVEAVIRTHCQLRKWTLHAINVRTNHVHVVCAAKVPPEKVMGQFKAWASRRLREHDPTIEKIWTRHGSTRWIDSDSSFRRAIEYVTNEQ
jgi:REP element-mobilizing transposase RayT